MHIADTYEDTLILSTEALLDEDFDILDIEYALATDHQTAHIIPDDDE